MHHRSLHTSKKFRIFLPLLLSLTLGACIGCSEDDDAGKSGDGDIVTKPLDASCSFPEVKAEGTVRASTTSETTSSAALDYTKKQKAGQISVMAYNVENLFNTKHDPGTEDFTYQPISQKNTPQHKENCKANGSGFYFRQCLELDWSDETLAVKMTNLADAVLQVNAGTGPDVLILEEVENIDILTTFNDDYLQAAKYTTVELIEGPDKRGIDIAVLSRLPATKTELHKIPFIADIDCSNRYKAADKDTAEKRVALTEREQAKMNRSRGIFQVDLTLPDGEALVVFGVHFPSPGNPSYWRAQSINHLKSLQSKLPKGTMTIAGGDFNITSAEDTRLNRYNGELGKTWLISHEIGCFTCVGTNFYPRKQEWSFLDALAFGPELGMNGDAKWKVLAQSIATPNKTDQQRNEQGLTLRYDPVKMIGASDHWPVYALIEKR